MFRLLRSLVELVSAAHIACPLLVSTGVHTTLLVTLGVIVAGSSHQASRPSIAMAVGLAAASSGDGELDATPLDAASLALGDAGDSGGAAAANFSQTQLNSADVQLAAAPLRGAVEDELFGALASPIDIQGTADASTGREPAPDGAVSADGSGKNSGETGTTESHGSGSGKPGKAGGRSQGRSGKGSGNSGAVSEKGGFFGLPTAGNKVVFVVDISGSMHGRRIRRAQTELRHTLESLKPSQQFFVVFFSDGALAMPAEGLLTATRDNVVQAWQWIKEAQCGGGTNPLPAVLLALQLKPDAIYLLTDGKFEPQVFWAATEAPRGQRTPINTIGFATKKAERLLQAIANETGGSYRFIP